MAERLKDQFFTQDSVKTMAGVLKEHYRQFDEKRFLKLVFDGTFEQKELKERMRHVTVAPGQYLIKRKQSFIDMSTRKHYPGGHLITIIVNGVDQVEQGLQLL